MEGTRPDNKRNLIILIAAFAAVYVIWGSTYLAIKYAIDTIPSFLMAGVRFLVAGGILYTVARFSPSYEKPKAVHWRTSFIVGALLLGIGNGGVVVAEHYISSSLTALLVATTPFWMVLIGWLFMGKGRPGYKVALGLLIGFIGVVTLISGRGGSAETGNDSQLLGIILILVATLGWSIGSLYGTRAPAAKSTFMAAGMQMLSGGLILMVMSLVSGEWSTFNYDGVSSTSWLALIYLIFIGALVAYTAYSWLLKNASPSTISTYAYVNPAVAVFLGWAIAGETLTGQMLIGAAVIVGSVVLITSKKDKAPGDALEVHESIKPADSRKPLTASA
ncbi:MAG: EamA family transporter [Pyrinomonadaceae bacterium]